MVWARIFLKKFSLLFFRQMFFQCIYFKINLNAVILSFEFSPASPNNLCAVVTMLLCIMIFQRQHLVDHCESRHPRNKKCFNRLSINIFLHGLQLAVSGIYSSAGVTGSWYWSIQERQWLVLAKG